MRVAVASDHAGFELKELVRACVAAAGHTVLDLGTDSATKPDDYADFARAIGEAIVTGKADRGVLVCGSGVGASVAANKIPGVRAGLCHDHYSAHQGVEHDDVNVLVLGARVIGVEPAKELVSAFLAAKFSGEERHARRLKKVLEIERNPTRAKP